MKVKLNLLAIFISISCLYGYSQELANTAWSVYFPNKTFLADFYFGTDTLSFSQNNTSYTNISTFQESGTTLLLSIYQQKTTPELLTILGIILS